MPKIGVSFCGQEGGKAQMNLGKTASQTPASVLDLHLPTLEGWKAELTYVTDLLLS